MMYLTEKNGDKKRCARRVGGWRGEKREPRREGDHRGGRKGGVYMLGIISNVSSDIFGLSRAYHESHFNVYMNLH